jgi:hypothetical protein
MKLDKAIIIKDFISSTETLLLKEQEVRIRYTPDSTFEEDIIDIWRCSDGMYCGTLNPRVETDYLKII